MSMRKSVSPTSIKGLAAAVVTLAIGMCPFRVGAQQVGDRVRVALPDATVVGEVVAQNAASIGIALEDGTVLSANHSEVFRLQRSFPRGWVWVAGVGVGLGVGCLLSGCEDASWTDADAWTMPGIGAVAGFAVTALGGFELWEDIPFPDRPEGPIVGDRVRVALPDMTIEGNVTSIGHRGFEVAGQDGSVQSVDRSRVLRLEERVASRRRWPEGLAAGFVPSLAYLLGKFFTQAGNALGCAFTLGYEPICEELGLGDGERLFVAAVPIAGLAIGWTQRTVAWERIEPRSPGSQLTPTIDVGIGTSGQPVVLLGARFWH